jgi:hypothetical protein
MGENQKTRQLIVRLSDYEEFEGVTYPTRVRQTFADTESTSEYRYLSVEQNVDDDHDYSVPDSIVEFFDKIKKNAQERSGEPAGADADG